MCQPDTTTPTPTLFVTFVEEFDWIGIITTVVEKYEEIAVKKLKKKVCLFL